MARLKAPDLVVTHQVGATSRRLYEELGLESPRIFRRLSIWAIAVRRCPPRCVWRTVA